MYDEWSHPNPVFVDFETQSACDIARGGRMYADHESTRVLILAMSVDNKFHVWIPDHIRVDTSKWDATRLWPYQIKPRRPVTLYRGDSCPAEMVKLVGHRPLVAHNAFGFDKFIWERFVSDKAARWIDTLYLARIGARPGGLDRLGKELLGIGKDRAKKLLPLLTTAKPSTLYDDDDDPIKSSFSYPSIKPGDLQAFTTYAIADVELIQRLLKTFADLQVEADIIAAHNSINDRGVRIDTKLLTHIAQLSEYSQDQAANEIGRLTGGKLHANNIRSVQQVHKWLAGYGILIVDDAGKPCLRKDIVQRYIDSPYLIDSYLEASREIPPVVVSVLQLRMKALRITDAKVKRAIESVSGDGRIRDLHTYHKAHTGRASSQRMQIHNLPRPHPDLNNRSITGISYLETIVRYLETTPTNRDVSKVYASVKQLLPAAPAATVDAAPAATGCNVDDVCSTLLRLAFLPRVDYLLAIADYAAIEARIVAWMAGEESLLTLFRDNHDVYKDFAARVLGIKPAQVSKEQRNGIGKVGILGLGYGMGPPKARIFAATAGVDLVAAGITAEQLVETYRDQYPAIAGKRPNPRQSFRVGGLWRELDAAVKETVTHHSTTAAGRCQFHMQRGDMIIELPSGREIQYPDAKIEDIIPPYCYTMGLPLNPKATATYLSPRGRKSLYGGLITENIGQAVGRDLLMIALAKVEAAGYNPVLHVHDEAVTEVPITTARKDLQGILDIMADPPNWAEGLPIKVEGFLSPRFTKKPFQGYEIVSDKGL